DASVLLLHKLGIVDAMDPQFASTVDTLGRQLGRNGHLLRYSAADDFGEPSMSFTMCTLWYIEALAAIGRVEQARQLFEAVLARRNHVGLLSEDLDPATGTLGEFPPNIFHGRHHPCGHALVRTLGSDVMPLLRSGACGRLSFIFDSRTARHP